MDWLKDMASICGLMGLLSKATSNKVTGTDMEFGYPKVGKKRTKDTTY